MINTLEISRFKSIKSLLLNCRRINLFIGEPNTGKSNILETLGLWSFLWYGDERGARAREFFRFERILNLFHDEEIHEPLEIRCDELRLNVRAVMGEFRGQLTYPGPDSPWRPGIFPGVFVDGVRRVDVLNGDHLGVKPDGRIPESVVPRIERVKFYRFRVRSEFPEPESAFLKPPTGDNLLSLLVANRELRSVVNHPFRSQGLRLGLRPQEGKIEVVKSIEDEIIIPYPYSLASETLQRLTFYQAAILSNQNSVLVFEEPESHSFPYHTIYLAEQIALDESGNQYFIATHNPYFLLPVLEKAKKEDVAVHIVYYEDYETKTKELAPEDLTELAEVDVFTNLERYLTVQ